MTVSLTPAQQVEEEDGSLRVEYLDRDARVEVETFVEQPVGYEDITSLLTISRLLGCSICLAGSRRHSPVSSRHLTVDLEDQQRLTEPGLGNIRPG